MTVGREKHAPFVFVRTAIRGRAAIRDCADVRDNTAIRDRAYVHSYSCFSTNHQPTHLSEISSLCVNQM